MGFTDTKTDGVSTLPAAEYNTLVDNLALKPADYIIYKDGADTVAVNGSTGVEDSRNTDAATVIQYALDAIDANNLSKLFIKKGDYELSAGLTVEGHGMIIEGSSLWDSTTDAGGAAAYINLGDDVDETMFTVTGDKCYIHNLRLDGNKANNAGGGGILIPPGATALDIHLSHMYIFNCAGNGIALHGWGSHINNIWSEFNGNIGILISDDHNSIVSCGTYGNTGYGIDLGGSINLVENCFMWLDNVGIVSEQNGNIINGNMISSPDHDGIWLYQHDNNIVTNNQIISAGLAANNTYDAIKVDAADYNVIKNNSVYTHAGAVFPAYGIREHGSSDYNIIQGNVLRSCVTAGILLAGANTISSFNQGHITEKSGTATILNTGTDIVVAHGLAATPTVINVTGQHAEVSDLEVGTIGAANFTITTIGGAVSADRDIYWEAKIR